MIKLLVILAIVAVVIALLARRAGPRITRIEHRRDDEDQR